MIKKTAIIIGATGLVGSDLLSLLLESDKYERVISVGRRLSGQKHCKLDEVVTSLEKISTIELEGNIDHAFCCLGTTMKKAGSKQAFFKVDYSYVMEFAKLVKKHGVNNFSVVSAIGADSESMFYYNQVKGKMEEALADFEFQSLNIFRPSLLLGDRKEARLGEDIGKLMNSVFAPVIPKKYKGIHSEAVATVMLTLSDEPQSGQHVFVSDKIQDLFKKVL